jgi:hypothetical protein
MISFWTTKKRCLVLHVPSLSLDELGLPIYEATSEWEKYIYDLASLGKCSRNHGDILELDGLT